jgi:DNA-binding winged helix-turn-helix (wHTH) protein/TolB-like protein
MNLRFGAFDFDPQTGELKREGLPVRLQSQPAQVLAALLDRAGEIVTRESLRQTIWGQETHVDFDRGLNFCIAQIRAALGDSADSPTCIKTFPKRGYQFIAPVHRIDTAVSPPKHSRRWLFAATLPAAMLAGLIAWKRPWLPAALPTIAIARFDNETGSPALDRFAEGLTDTLIGEMTGLGTGRYAVIGNASILLTPRSFRDLKAIGSALNARYVVLGQIQRNATAVRVLAHLIRLPEQTHLTVARIDFTDPDPLRAESDLAKQIAARFHHRLT